MAELERDIEAALRRMVESHGGRCLKWVCPGWQGVPDRIILLPGGLVMFAETKRPRGGRLSKLQERWLAWLAALGFASWVVWTRDDIDRVEQYIKERLK